MSSANCKRRFPHAVRRLVSEPCPHCEVERLEKENQESAVWQLNALESIKDLEAKVERLQGKLERVESVLSTWKVQDLVITEGNPEMFAVAWWIDELEAALADPEAE